LRSAGPTRAARGRRLLSEVAESGNLPRRRTLSRRCSSKISTPPSRPGSAARSSTPTPAQVAAWPAIHAGRHTLVAAPTGSGKTLTAFLAGLDALVREGLQPGGLADATSVVYVSPLKALSNDIRLNLEAPLAGIRAELAAAGLPDVEIRTAVRTGDTTPQERRQSLRRPPHILVTTPESLYVLLGSESGRRMLATTRSVIVDEIHALAAGKRGSHLALSLGALQALVCAAAGADRAVGDAEAGRRSRAIPGRGGAGIDHRDGRCRRAVAVGTRIGTAAAAACEIVDIGYAKERDLALELPPTPLGAVMSNDQWEQVYGRVAELVWQHRTTLVFVNTRRMAERAARHLGERLGKEAVGAHHGSLAKEVRLDAEQRLKRGDLKVLVATASLELGLDVGDVDLVCQLGSPRSIATFLQRAGRSGHRGRRRSEGTPLSADPRRAGRMRGAARLRAARRARRAARAAGAARCAGPADHCRDRLPRMGRGRAVRAGAGAPGRMPLCRASATTRSCGWSSRATRRATARAPATSPRCRAPSAARAQGRAHDRTDLRRHDSRDRRLRGRARAAGARHRHRQRGLRGREHRRATCSSSATPATGS
jgi:superfamily II DNA/RNA helicase